MNVPDLNVLDLDVFVHLNQLVHKGFRAFVSHAVTRLCGLTRTTVT